MEPRGLGRVAVAPVDVILDEPQALVLQPDVLFVSTDRLSIVRNQVWGAPDMVAEVLSPGSERDDRTRKLTWYRQYGVRECWLVNQFERDVEVIGFDNGVERSRVRAAPNRPIPSIVLPTFTRSLNGMLDE